MTTLTSEIDRTARRIDFLKTLSPVGYPWVAAEIAKLEARLAGLAAEQEKAKRGRAA